MANTIARAQGYNKDGSPKSKEATRLGGGSARAEANTWRTFAKVETNADGSVLIQVSRDDKYLLAIYVNAETEDVPEVVVKTNVPFPVKSL